MQLLLYQVKYLALLMMQMRPIVDMDKLFGCITKGTNIKTVLKNETHSVKYFCTNEDSISSMEIAAEGTPLPEFSYGIGKKKKKINPTIKKSCSDSERQRMDPIICKLITPVR